MDPRIQLRLGVVAFVGLAAVWACGDAGARPEPDPGNDALQIGKELFTREWLPNDKRSHAGNGLGPVFNARSCAACHHQGGVGGSGPKESNATIVSTFVISVPRANIQVQITSGVSVHKILAPDNQLDRSKLAEIHPALRTEGSFPLHRFSLEEGFQDWKTKKLGTMDRDFHGFDFGAGGIGGIGGGVGMFGGFGGMGFGVGARNVGNVSVTLIQSERNTPSLFGIGLIDRIPDQVLKDVAAEQAKASVNQAKTANKEQPTSVRMNRFGMGEPALPVRGRLAILKDGRIGRFGWKSNMATLRKFTLQACSSEIGLEVPGFSRAAPAWIKNYKAPGLDLTSEQCDCLVQFIASLPRPVVRPSENAQHAAEIEAGQKHFAAIGCADCHRTKLGDVTGIYSDLLLHDMGQSMSGTGFYGTTIEAVKSAGDKDPAPAKISATAKKSKETQPKFGADAREWRTPPLWGLRDSSPYMHDGRADTITDAILMHRGEGFSAAQRFDNLKPREQFQIELFLQSLAVPAPDSR